MEGHLIIIQVPKSFADLLPKWKDVSHIAMAIQLGSSVLPSLSKKSRNSKARCASVPEWKLRDAYKKNVVRMYDNYSQTYDSGSWHLEIGTELTQGCGMKHGDSVLDMCAGTGISTLIAADQVGANGNVVGVDFSQKMLDKAEEKIKMMRSE